VYGIDESYCRFLAFGMAIKVIPKSGVHDKRKSQQLTKFYALTRQLECDAASGWE